MAEYVIDQERYPRPSWAIYQVVRASGLVEDICIHNIGHPNIQSVAEFEARGITSMSVHGCDGCCCYEEDEEN